MTGAGAVVVAAVGNAYRGDDGVGPAVIGRVTAALPAVVDVGPVADPLDLLGRWDGAGCAVLVDAMRSGADPGTVTVVDLDDVPDDPRVRPTSSHGLGLSRALRIGRAVGRAPGRVLVVAVEGCDFADGDRLSPAVARAVPDAARRVLELVAGGAPCA